MAKKKAYTSDNTKSGASKKKKNQNTSSNSKKKKTTKSTSGSSQPEDALFKRMMKNGNMTKSEAVATAKKRGWVEQDGAHLKLTKEGRKHASKASRSQRKEDKKKNNK